MEVIAKANNIRMSARKVRLVLNVVRGMETGKALNQLKFINKLAAKPVKKLLDSAIANAENNFSLDKDNLYIKTLTADEGQTLHRWMPKARGRATPIRKRTTHVTVILAEIKESGKHEAKKQVAEAPVKLGVKPKEDEGVKIKTSKTDKGVESPDEKGKKIVDPRSEGKGKHTKIEGGNEKGFVGKMFRRKSG